MPIHDAYARVTPFEKAFPDPAAAEDRMERIRRDVEAEGMEGAREDPGRFLTLPAVAEVVHGIRDPGSGGEEVQKHGIFLYHAYHFHEAGQRLHLLTTPVTRYLVETDPTGSESEQGAEDADVSGGEGPVQTSAEEDTGDGEDGDDGDARVRPPGPAGYLQLPRQLFWMEPGGEDAPPEPVDGIFWASPDGQRLSLLVIGGMRENRPGFSVVPLPPVPLSDAGSWIRTRTRESEPDFQTTLPGGELERLYSFETTGEVLKLVGRVFRYLERHPRAVTEEQAPEEGSGTVGDVDSGDGPTPTGLRYRRIHLEDQLEGPSEEARAETPRDSRVEASGASSHDPPEESPAEEGDAGHAG